MSVISVDLWSVFVMLFTSLAIVVCNACFVSRNDTVRLWGSPQAVSCKIIWIWRSKILRSSYDFSNLVSVSEICCGKQFSWINIKNMLGFWSFAKYFLESKRWKEKEKVILCVKYVLFTKLLEGNHNILKIAVI